MTRFYKDGCNLEIADNNTLTSDEVTLLENIILEVGEILDPAIGASLAPRHGDPDGYRADYVKLRRKWFGKKRGRVRHTFQDIKSFLEDAGNTLVISTHGPQCKPGAHAYTPEHQIGTRLRIYLCNKFFSNSVKEQISTIVHELTHLIRNTEDIDVILRSDLNFESMAQPFDEAREAARKRKRYRVGLNEDDRALSAYNFEYFVEDLISKEYPDGVPLDPARRQD